VWHVGTGGLPVETSLIKGDFVNASVWSLGSFPKAEIREMLHNFLPKAVLLCKGSPWDEGRWAWGNVCGNGLSCVSNGEYPVPMEMVNDK